MGIFELSAETLEGTQCAFSAFKGKALLFVNVASKCGFTPQYAGLEALYREHREQGFEVLGFPCDQFGHQEPGDAEMIRDFCSLNYEVSFPLFAKVDVNGADAHPVWKWLKEQKSGFLGSSAIKWNFTKFLVDREGKVVARYSPTDAPDRIARDLPSVLG